MNRTVIRIVDNMHKIKRFHADDFDKRNFNLIAKTHRLLIREMNTILKRMSDEDYESFDNIMDWEDVAGLKRDFDILSEMGFNDELCAHLAGTNRMMQAYATLHEVSAKADITYLLDEKLLERVEFFIKSMPLMSYYDSLKEDMDTSSEYIAEVFELAQCLEYDSPNPVNELSYYSQEQNDVFFKTLEGLNEVRRSLKEDKNWRVTMSLKNFQMGHIIADAINPFSDF